MNTIKNLPSDEPTAASGKDLIGAQVVQDDADNLVVSKQGYHDAGNLIAGLHASIISIIEQTKDGPVQKRRMTDALSSLTVLAGLIQSRLISSSATSPTNKGLGNLLSISASCDAMMRPIIEQNGLRFNVCHGGCYDHFEYNTRVVIQTTLNLIHNSVKHTRSGTIALSIECLPRAVSEGHELVITVNDSGPGITKSEFAAVLGGRLNHINEMSGSGIGLRGIEQMLTTAGGRLTLAETAAGSGARLVVTLPVEIVRTKERRSRNQTHDVFVVSRDKAVKDALAKSVATNRLIDLPHIGRLEKTIRAERLDLIAPRLLLVDMKDVESLQEAGSLTGEAYRCDPEIVNIAILSDSHLAKCESVGIELASLGFKAWVNRGDLAASMQQYIYPSLDSAGRHSKAEGQISSDMGDISGARVVLAEDQEIFREFCTRVIQKAGATVVETSSALSAISEIKARHFGLDIAVFDVDLGGVHVETVVSAMREHEEKNGLAKLKFVLISGANLEDLTATAKRLGASAFLSKPFAAHQLVEVIRNVVWDVETVDQNPVEALLPKVIFEINPDLNNHLKEMYKKDIPLKIISMGEALKVNDKVRLGVELHALKSSAHLMGHERLKELCIAGANQNDMNEGSDVHEWFRQLTDEADRAFISVLFGTKIEKYQERLAA